MSTPQHQRPKTKSVGAAQDGRKRVIERVRRSLVRDGNPRLLVSFLLALTGASGFLISAVLLRLGVTMMAVRYPLAVILAYCVFLLLLRLWLALRRTDSSDLDHLADAGDVIPHLFDSAGSAGGEAARATFGGGGDFGGAGAGGGWSGGVTGSVPGGISGNVPGGAPGNMSANVSGGSSSATDWIPDVPDALDVDLGDGCFWIIIPIAAIAGVLFVMFYVVYIAPVFLAEIMVDALLLAGLYKRLKGVERRHWLRSCVRRTLLPALVATALFIAAGYLMGRIAPEAHSIGEFWLQINTVRVER
ncbi:MAG TPA: hypothetical protein VK388_08375 [Pyrinomonadaceae bacterium]|nr:hypothetical protein [Pyrinomonadaceae bacterium]